MTTAKIGPDLKVSFGAKKDRGTGFSVLAAREMKRERKNERGGRGRGKKEKKAKQFIGQLSQLMRVPNVGEQTQA